MVHRQRTSAEDTPRKKKRSEELAVDEGKARDGQRGGDPRGGGTRLVGPEAEVECQRAKCPCGTDAPEGVVVDLKEGVRVRPERRSGPKREIFKKEEKRARR